MSDAPPAEPQPVDDPQLGPLHQPSLADLAYESIKTGILVGRLAMDERLNETHLSGQLQVSRGTTRVALRRLADEGLVVERPRQGTFVRRFTWADAIDVYNLRVGIETTAARLVIRGVLEVDSLERIIDAMASAEEQQDLAQVSAREFGFHEELCRLSGNEWLLHTFQGLAGPIRMAFALDINPDYAGIAKRHRPVVAALRAGDEDEAVRTLHQHITGHLSQMLERAGHERGALLPSLV